MGLFKKKNKKNAEEVDASANKRQRVYSYYTASSQKLNSFERQSANNYKKETTKRKVRSLLRNWLYLLVGAVLAAVAIYLMTLNNDASVSVKGTQYREASEYTAVVNQILKKSWLNTFKPTIKTAEIEKQIKNDLPEASVVQVSVPFLGHRPDVNIVTDEAMAIFSENSSENYVLSQRGRVMLPVGESAASTKNLPVVYNKTGVQLEEGQQFINPSQAEALRKLIFQSSATANKSISFEVPPQPQEVYFRNTAEGGYYVKMLLDPENINQQYGAYLALLKKLAGAKPGEYIDARLADKVFVK